MANYDLDYEGSEVQDILDTGKSLEDDGYIFLGTATPSTIPGTPTERVAYVGGPGTYNNFGTTVVVPSGSIVVITYSGSAWSKTVINASLPVSTTLGSDNTTIPTSKAVKDVTDAINTKLGEGYLYVGIATAATNPGTPTVKVFYLARQAGTYTNFGGLTLTEGVNILKYNGTTWSQEQLISIADIFKNPLMGYYECDTAGATAAKTVAATGYVLPTTGGSVKIKMANRNTVANATLNINSTGAKPLFYNGQRAGVGNTWDTNEIVEVFYDGTNYQAYNVAGSNGDGVFDISAYNLTDGQPTPYIDLAAALGTDGEHVPQSLRKGGMSVKFIQGSAQSSDNKYVQYRLMDDDWSIDVNEWQGVDEEPKMGSQNLVKSEGIKTELNKVIPENLIASATGGQYFVYKTVQGHKYIAVNNSSTGRVQLILTTDNPADPESKQVLDGMAAGEQMKFTANESYNYIYVYFQEVSSVTIIDYNIYLENEDDINKSLGFKKQLAIPTLKRGKYYQVSSPDYKITVVDSIDESIYFDAIDVSAYIGKYVNVVFDKYVSGGGRKIAIGTLNTTTDSYIVESSPTSLIGDIATFRLLVTGNNLYISYTDLGKYITSIYVEDYTQVGSEIDKINNTIIGLLPKNAVKIELISKNIFNIETDYLDNTFVNVVGNVAEQSGWGVAKIPVTEGMILTFGHTLLGRDVYAAYYLGSVKVSMFDVTKSEGDLGKTITVPSGVDTLYIDIKTNGTPDGGYEDFTVNVGSILYPYDEYQKAVTKILGEKIYAINSGDENKHINEDMFSQPSYLLVKSRCSVNFSFDDSTIQDEDIKAVFDEFGLKCGFAIINGYNRYRQYAEEGFEILAHGGGSYSEASEATIRAAMVAGKKVVADLGLVCHGWVTPSSQLPADLTWVTNDYFEYGFTIYKGNDSTPANQLIPDTQKSYNLWRIHMDTLLSNYQNILDYAVQNDGVISIYGHGYELEGSGWDLNDLRTILQYCKTNGIEVLTPYRSFLKLFSDRHN